MGCSWLLSNSLVPKLHLGCVYLQNEQHSLIYGSQLLHVRSSYCKAMQALANHAQPFPYYAMPALLVNPSIMLDILLASSAVLYMYTRAVCASDNDGAIVELTLPSSILTVLFRKS